MKNRAQNEGGREQQNPDGDIPENQQPPEKAIPADGQPIPADKQPIIPLQEPIDDGMGVESGFSVDRIHRMILNRILLYKVYSHALIRMNGFS